MKQLWKNEMRMGKIMALLLPLMLICFGVPANSFSADNSITITGSTTVLPIAQNAAEVFMDRNRDVDISVQGGGSGVGIASLIDGTCDIATSSRSVKEKERKRAENKGVRLTGTVVAMDGIAVIVHPSNPIQGITKTQIHEIYTGKISHWSKISGFDKKIVVVSRDTASGTFEAFSALALNKVRVRPDALMQASNKTIAMMVARTPGAIGYVGLGYISPKVKPLRVNGVVPSKDTVLSGEYILTRPLFMYTNGEPQARVKDYITFVLSAEGQRLVEEIKFIGVK